MRVEAAALQQATRLWRGCMSIRGGHDVVRDPATRRTHELMLSVHDMSRLKGQPQPAIRPECLAQ